VLALTLLVLTAAPRSQEPAKPSLPSTATVLFADKHAQPLSNALSDEGVKLVDLTEVFPAPKPDDSGAKLVAAAKQAYDDLDYEGSIGKWNEALEFFIQHPASADAKTMGDIHFYLGALAIQNGGKAKSKQGTEEFTRALLFNASLTCDPSVYGADVKKAFDKALNDVATRPSARLTITSEPEGAAVSIHGKNLGETPLAEAPGVAPGRHLVTFTKTGYEQTGVFVDVTEAGASVDGKMKAAGGLADVLAAGEALDDAKSPDSKKLGEKLKSRFFIVKRGGSAEVWDVETGNRVKGLSLEKDALNDSAKKIAVFIANPSPLDVEQKDAPAASGDSVATKWWFWTIIGVAVVGGAAAGIGAAESHGKPFNIVLTPP
jgi:hypothetical protein